MATAVGGAIALLAAAASVGLSAAHLARVRASPSEGAEALIAALRRAPPGDRIALAFRTAIPGSWEAHLAADIAASRDGDELAMEVDTALADVDAGLVAVRAWSATGLRIGLFGGLLGAAVAALDLRIGATVAAAALGLAGAVVAGIVGGRATALEAAQRRRADDLVTTLLGGRAGAPSIKRDRGRNPRR